MSLRPKKSIVLAVQAEDFFHVKEGLRRVIKIVSADGASFWPKSWRWSIAVLNF